MKINLGLSKSRYLRVPITNADYIRKVADISYGKKGTIDFLFFWGVALKEHPDEIDRIALAHLNMLIAQLSNTFLRGCRLHLLLADIHGKANEVSSSLIHSYFNGIYKLAEEFQMKPIYLSSILPDTFIETLSNVGTDEVKRFKVVKTDFVKSASKFGFPNTADRRALNYFLVRLRERKIIKSNFPNHILLSGDRPCRQFLLPELPVIFINSMGPKNNQKPWLLKLNKK